MLPEAVSGPPARCRESSIHHTNPTRDIKCKCFPARNLKFEAHRRSTELEEIKKDRERITAELLDTTAELNQIKAENTESKSRMDGIIRIVEGFFVHRG
jgi:hypothetical protein